MLSNQPQIARLSNRKQWRLRNLLGDIWSRLRFLGNGQQRIQLVAGETRQVKIEAIGLQGAHLLSENHLVPSGQFRQSIVSEDVRPPLGLVEVVQYNDRHLDEAQLPGRKEAPMASDNSRVGVHQDRIDKPELDDGRRNLGHLLRRMSSGVSLVGPEAVDGPDLDSPGHGWRDGGGVHVGLPKDSQSG